MSASLSLAQMADLALGTPELGAVNFNVLHTLLHAILQKLDLGNAKADIDKYDKDFLQAKKDDPETGSVAETDITDKDSAITGMTDGGKTSGKGRPSSAKSYPRAPYHALEDKVKRLEYQMQQLNDLPSNDELFEQTRGDGERPRPASDMWQQMQMKNKVDANEEGVSKLMSLVDDLMKEMLSLKDDNDKLKKQIEQASDVGDLLNRLKALEDRMNELNDKFSQLPSDEFYDGFVTWQALEDALKGLRTELEPQERVVIEMSQQTDVLSRVLDAKPAPRPPPEKPAVVERVKTPPVAQVAPTRPVSRKSRKRSIPETQDVGFNVAPETAEVSVNIPSRPPSSRPATRQSTRPNSARSSTPGPSIDLAELLQRLGKLSDQHDILEERVKVLEDEIKNKANKDALDALSVPDDLLNQLKDMADLLEQLKKNRDKDSDALSRMQQAILNLQAELERLSNVTQQLIDDNTTKQQHIDTLYETTKNLEENKADKEYVQSELEVKADKRHLDGKVNRSLFDNTCDDLNKMIQDILNKLQGHEDEWRKALAAMIEDLDGKLDRLEFGPIRDELERQLKALLRKLNGMHFGQAVDDDDAAGIRKQLIQKFHCISCDRPVDMVPTGPVPAIPQSAGMPATRSARPYTTFELEQIRQHAKRDYESMNGPQIDVMDLYATQRACGGSHTTTVPHRRITRMTHINNLFRDDTELMGPAYKEEQDIQGADGHIYRGRAQDKLPQLPQTAPPMAMQNSKTSPRTSRKQMPVKPFTAQPPTPRSPRASSARQNRGGSAGKPSSRPQSAAGGQHTEVPTAGEIASPPPPPATSEMDPQDQGSLPLRTPTPGQTNGLDN